MKPVTTKLPRKSPEKSGNPEVTVRGAGLEKVNLVFLL